MTTAHIINYIPFKTTNTEQINRCLSGQSYLQYYNSKTQQKLRIFIILPFNVLKFFLDTPRYLKKKPQNLPYTTLYKIIIFIYFQIATDKYLI